MTVEHATLDDLPLPTVLVDGDRITRANELAARLLSLPLEEIVGRRWIEFVAPEDRASMLERNRRRQAGEVVPTTYETTVLGAGGERVRVQVRLAYARGRAVFHLVDLRTQAQRRERLELLATLGAKVQRGETSSDVHRAVREGMLALGLHPTLLALEPDGRGRIEWADDGTEVPLLEKLSGMPVVGLVRPLNRAAHEIVAEGARYIEDWPREVEEFVGMPGVAALLRTLEPAGYFERGVGVRIDVHGRPRAILAATGEWLQPDDVVPMRLLASQIGAALEAARRLEELTLLNDVAVATATLEPALLLDNALRRVTATLGCDLSIAWLLEGDRLTRRASHGVTAEALASAPREGPDLAELALERMAPVRAADAPEPRRRWMREVLGVEAAVAVPLLGKDRALGAIAVGHRSRTPFSDADVRLLSSVGAQLGMAVENARLFASTQRRVADLEAVNSLALQVFTTAPGDGARLLHATCREIASALGAEAATILRLDAEGRRLVGVAASGIPVPAEKLAIDVERTPIAAEALRTQEPAWAPSVVMHGTAGGARSAPPLSVLFVPLTSRSATRGLVAIADQPSRRYGDAEIALAYALASEAAMAIENAELYSEAQRRVDELSRLAGENARLYDDLRRSYADLARAQEQLVQRERLAALGELAAVVAHEIRNPLGAIFNSLGTLRRLVPPGGDARMLLDIVGEESDRLNRIVGDMLDFARPATPRMRAEPLDRVLDDAAQAALAGAEAAIRLDRDVPPDLPPVPMDARLMRQAMLNVMANAVQAMTATGGTLTVRARDEGERVRVEVADTGGGIPEEVRHRIFEPFFTTRATGTGLGLAVVKRILEDHRAAFEVEAAEGGGTRFVVHLPREAGPVENDAPLWSR